MGTNYYIKRNFCKCCGRFDEIHIGKSSGGWCFGLHVKTPGSDENLPENLMEWEELFKNNEIVNEYGEIITKEEMMDIITDRSSDRPLPTDRIKLAEIHGPYSEAGPNNLLRSKIHDGHCIGHGAGTWDLIIGEFS